jgi:hypothetical protein
MGAGMSSVKALLFLALLSPALASAGVFVCVDPATGKKTFTDKACETKGKGEKLDVKPRNFGDSGHRQGSSGQKTWNSDRAAEGVATTQYTGHRRQVEQARGAGSGK